MGAGDYSEAAVGEFRLGRGLAEEREVGGGEGGGVEGVREVGKGGGPIWGDGWWWRRCGAHFFPVFSPLSPFQFWLLGLAWFVFGAC